MNGLSSIGSGSALVGPADVLALQLTTGLDSEESEPVLLRVAEDGSVDVPLVGPVPVSGLEPTQAGQRIATVAVQRGIYTRPQVNLRVEEQATHRVTVLGAVNEPGVREVPRTACDLINAIAAAGGFSENAGAVVEVLRHDGLPSASSGLVENGEGGDSQEIKQVAFEAPSTNGIVRSERIDLANNHALTATQQKLGDRDVIIVRPREKRVVYVSGLVKEPDQFDLPEDHDLRVLDAVAMAGGTTTNIADKVLVIRQMSGVAEPVVVSVSMSEAKKNGAENLLLQSGDLVSVEATVATTVAETFTDLFRITMGVGGNLSLF